MPTIRQLMSVHGDHVCDLESTLSGSFHTPIVPPECAINCAECEKPLTVRSGKAIGMTEGPGPWVRLEAHCMQCEAVIGQILERETR